MKKLNFLLVLLLVVNISCSSSDDMEIPEDPVVDVNSPMIAPNAFISGSFVSDAHPTSGTAEVNKEMTKLIFRNFKSDDGPKLLVYLSTDKNSTDFVDLGDLKGLSGNYEYAIPNGTDLNKYNVVSIWCVDFLVSFGHAELK
ncbi:DM13 domain-containing protein [Urechidicola vernalis]|uniref:DM13 domain-containing protein n=1 Tax=Urechidicola vernalis TaxID=3075600 RepID=A0ABU2Y5U4_9FLAO|nr:DM13 domain-containing protein [Urechidicola sp. P050]MDT0553140.1 DM13 domain-containing protein [Urechidicola sp. P050]